MFSSEKPSILSPSFPVPPLPPQLFRHCSWDTDKGVPAPCHLPPSRFSCPPPKGGHALQPHNILLYLPFTSRRKSTCPGLAANPSGTLIQSPSRPYLSRYSQRYSQLLPNQWSHYILFFKHALWLHVSQTIPSFCKVIPNSTDEQIHQSNFKEEMPGLHLINPDSVELGEGSWRGGWGSF